MNLFCLAVIFTLGFSTVSFGNEDTGHVCFSVIDADKDGAVTFQEFKEYFGDHREQYDGIDSNGDGKLTHDEYHDSLGHGAS